MCVLSESSGDWPVCGGGGRAQQLFVCFARFSKQATPWWDRRIHSDYFFLVSFVNEPLIRYWIEPKRWREKKKQENGGIFNVRKNFVQLKLRSLRSSLERKKKIKQAASRESSCKENCQRVFSFNSSLTGLSSSFSVLYLPSFKKKKMNEKKSCVLCNTIKDRHWLN